MSTRVYQSDEERRLARNIRDRDRRKRMRAKREAERVANLPPNADVTLMVTVRAGQIAEEMGFYPTIAQTLMNLAKVSR